MPDGKFPDPREEDIMAGDRRLSRPDASVPDWEVPDTSYRPIPIVWFTGAFVIQMVAVFAIFVALIGQHGGFTIALSAGVTAILAAWTWDRGMNHAGRGWQVATVLVLSATFLLVCAGAWSRI